MISIFFFLLLNGLICFILALYLSLCVYFFCKCMDSNEGSVSLKKLLWHVCIQTCAEQKHCDKRWSKEVPLQMLSSIAKTSTNATETVTQPKPSLVSHTGIRAHQKVACWSGPARWLLLLHSTNCLTYLTPTTDRTYCVGFFWDGRVLCEKSVCLDVRLL